MKSSTLALLRRGLRQLGDAVLEVAASDFQRAGALAQRAAEHTDKAGAEALHARVVLVAAALVDLALAAKRRFQRQHRDAVALHRAIAAALADAFVDEDAARRVDQLTLLAAAPLFGSTGLLVDQHRDALD